MNSSYIIFDYTYMHMHVTYFYITICLSIQIALKNLLKYKRIYIYSHTHINIISLFQILELFFLISDLSYFSCYLFSIIFLFQMEELFFATSWNYWILFIRKWNRKSNKKRKKMHFLCLFWITFSMPLQFRFPCSTKEKMGTQNRSLAQRDTDTPTIIMFGTRSIPIGTSGYHKILQTVSVGFLITVMEF